MNEIFKLTDVIRYTKYEPSTALVILVNDVLNLHLRPTSIADHTIVNGPLKVTVDIDLKIDPAILVDGGKYYTGSVSVTYDKINISTVYPGGFLIPRWMGLESILNTLRIETGVNINKEDCILSNTGNIRTLEILPESLFWYGALVIKITEPLMVTEVDIEPPPNIDTILDGTVLDGFNHSFLLDLMDGTSLDGFDQVTYGSPLNGFITP